MGKDKVGKRWFGFLVWIKFFATFFKQYERPIKRKQPAKASV